MSDSTTPAVFELASGRQVECMVPDPIPAVVALVIVLASSDTQVLPGEEPGEVASQARYFRRETVETLPDLSGARGRYREISEPAARDDSPRRVHCHFETTPEQDAAIADGRATMRELLAQFLGPRLSG